MELKVVKMQTRAIKFSTIKTENLNNYTKRSYFIVHYYIIYPDTGIVPEGNSQYIVI